MSAMKNIHQRLAAVMAAVTYIQKERKAGMNYTIVSHDAVTAKVRPVMLQNGVVYYPIRCDHAHNGNRAECSMTVRFANIDEPSDYIDVQTFGYGVDPQDKGPGKAMSYAVKYALLKALGLETGDDADHDDIPHSPIDPAIPKFDARAAADRIIGNLRKQTTVEALTAAWKDETDARMDVKAAAPAIYAEIETASKERAAELRPKEQAA